jgi:GT2 family glycosyltransferase
LNNKIKLTISIPIYKRPEFLKRALRSISNNINQKNYNFEIKIYLIDDSCTNINEEVVNNFIEENTTIDVKYIKNDKNVGIDKNICNSLFLPESDYIWLMGEDDLIVENSFQILDKYLKNDFDFIAVNYATVDNNYNVIRKSNFPYETSIPFTEYNIIDLLDFLNNYFIYIGFIGSCIYKKSIINNQHYKNYIGSYFSHLSPFLLKRENWKICIISNPLVCNRAEDFSSFSWKDDAFDVMFGMVELVKNPNTNLNNEFKRKLEIKLTEFQEIYKFKRLVSLRAEGILNKIIFYKYYFPLYKKNIFKTFYVFIISNLPIAPLKLIKKQFKKNKSK